VSRAGQQGIVVTCLLRFSGGSVATPTQTCRLSQMHNARSATVTYSAGWVCLPTHNVSGVSAFHAAAWVTVDYGSTVKAPMLFAPRETE